MRVKELKELLATMPDDAFVRYVWDGEPRTAVKNVWLSRRGTVMLGGNWQSVYSEDARPADAPPGIHWSAPYVEEEDGEEDFEF